MKIMHARYIAGNLDKSTLKMTRIHSKLKYLSMAFLEINLFVVFLCKIRGKMGEIEMKLVKKMPLNKAEH